MQIKNNTQFTVLLSLYHKETVQNLDTALKSIWMEQTLKPNEIIMVLDGPIPFELSICLEKWKHILKDIIKIVALPENKGLGLALNEGIEHCTHSWIFRMDTDDVCTPDRFEKQITYIENNPNVVLLGGQILEFNDSIDDAKVLKAVPTTIPKIRQFSISRCPFNHMTVAYKKDVIQLLGGYQHHLYMEDYNLWLRVIASGYEVANLDDVIVYARVGNGMYGRRKGLQYIKSEKKLMDLKKSLAIQKPLNAYSTFLFRSIVRLLPSSILEKGYNMFLRKSFKK